MVEILTPMVFSIFIWWFSTGLLLFLVRLIDRWEKFPSKPEFSQYCSVIASMPIFILGLYLYHNTLGVVTNGAIYTSFISALIIWGWLEFAFLCGVLTGPNTTTCSKSDLGWSRFQKSLATILYSEIAIILTYIWLIFFGLGAENYFGLLTFSVLYFARLSAKLNLYFGVPYINFEFLPGPLQHFGSYFRVRKVTAMFPISITLITCAAFFFLEHLFHSASAEFSNQVGFALVLSLTLLALLEHWFMVMPLPDSKLWMWMLPGNTEFNAKRSRQHVT